MMFMACMYIRLYHVYYITVVLNCRLISVACMLISSMNISVGVNYRTASDERAKAWERG